MDIWVDCSIIYANLLSLALSNYLELTRSVSPQLFKEIATQVARGSEEAAKSGRRSWLQRHSAGDEALIN